MVDSTVRRVGLLMNLASLLLYLVMMDIIDLEMMRWKWEVPIKSVRDAGKRYYSGEKAECELCCCVLRFW